MLFDTEISLSPEVKDERPIANIFSKADFMNVTVNSTVVYVPFFPIRDPSTRPSVASLHSVVAF
jgi:hypothetical protein